MTLARWTALALALAAVTGCSPASDAACTQGQVATEQGCVPEACGTGPFHADGGGDLHVAIDGSDSADGSADAPLAGLDEALDRLEGAGGGRLLLGAGTWNGAWTVPDTADGVELIGRCKELTVLEGDDDSRVLRIEGPARIAHLSTHSGRKAIRLEPGVGTEDDPIALEDLAIRDAWWIGIYAEEAHVALERVTVEGTLENPEPTTQEPRWGYGFHVIGGTATVVSSRFIDNRDEGIRIELGARTRMEDVEIEGGGMGVNCRDPGSELVITGLRASEGDPEFFVSAAVSFTDGCAMVAEDLRISGYGTGISGVHGPGELHDAEIRGTWNTCLEPWFGAEITGSNLLLEDCGKHGLFASAAGTLVDLEDVTIRSIRNLEGWSFGVKVLFDAEVRLERALIEDINGRGVWLFTGGPRLELVDAVVRNITSPATGNGMGLFVTGAAAEIALEDVEISDTEGPALLASSAGNITGTGVTVMRPGFAGLVALGGAVDLAGLTIEDPGSAPGNGGGFGVYATSNTYSLPDLRLEDFELSGTIGPGIYLLGPGSYVFTDGEIGDGGAGPLPGGLFAAEGVTARSGDEGVLLSGVAIQNVRRDCVLLDDSSAWLEDVACAGQDGEPLWWQGCDEADPPTVQASPGLDPACREVHRQTRPLAGYTFIVSDPGLAD